MQLPFTALEFFAVFREYNEAVWPAQIFLLSAAVIAVALVFRPVRGADIIISAVLGFLWGWLALVYHLKFFTAINPLAYVFSGVSFVGALTFVWQGVIRRRLHFGWVKGGRGTLGAVLVMFALLVYPAWSWYAGHTYPSMPTFGLPCPTTIFTIGILGFLLAPSPRSVYIVPILWSVVGGLAAFSLGVPQDVGLIVAGLVGVGFMLWPQPGALK